MQCLVCNNDACKLNGIVMKALEGAENWPCSECGMLRNDVDPRDLDQPRIPAGTPGTSHRA